MPVTSLCHYLKNGPASSTPFYAVPALPQLPARQVSAIQSADSTRMAVAVGNSVELIRLAESVAWIPRLKWRQDHRGAVIVRARNSPGAPAMGAYTDLNYRGHTARDRLGARRHLAPVRLGPLESRCKISLVSACEVATDHLRMQCAQKRTLIGPELIRAAVVAKGSKTRCGGVLVSLLPSSNPTRRPPRCPLMPHLNITTGEDRLASPIRDLQDHTQRILTGPTV